MGRVAVRAAIVDYLQSAGIPYLGTVFPHPPKMASEEDFFVNSVPGTAAGATIFVALRRQRERRIALGGPNNGRKLRPYKVTLLCFLRSKATTTQEAGDENDAFIDALVSAIEGNRTAASDAIFQWGEGDDLYEFDIEVDTGLPRPLRLQMTQVFSTVDVTALEMLAT